MEGSWIPEQVGEYPRPPRVRSVRANVRVTFRGWEIAAADEVLEVLETWHPPTVYLDPKVFRPGVLISADRTSFCEFKGRAAYLHLDTPHGCLRHVGWSYRQPSRPYEALRDQVALYPTLLECWWNDERVRGQEGGFYGGWITSRVRGPFKGDGGWNPDR